MPHHTVAKYGEHARSTKKARKVVELMLPGQTRRGIAQDFAMVNKRRVKHIKSFAAMTPSQRKRVDVRGADDGTRKLKKLYGKRHAFPKFSGQELRDDDAPPPLRKRPRK